jgi:hypothetical protein
MRTSMSSQVSSAHGVKVLTYGPSGVGKTTLIATAPKPVLISAESGVLSLRPANLQKLYGVNTPGVTYDVPLILISTIADFDEAYRWCATSHEARQFQTLGIDSISEVAERVLEHALKTVGAKDPRKAYGELSEKVVKLTKDFRDLAGFHVYVSAKMGAMKDEQTGLTTYGPDAPGQKVGPALPFLFDEVFRLGVASPPNAPKYRYLQTDIDAQYIAKDRSGMLDAIEPPNLTHIFRKILGA